jgi:hypothetical protein
MIMSYGPFMGEEVSRLIPQLNSCDVSSYLGDTEHSVSLFNTADKGPFWGGS